ncbi:MAG: hypothetical protein KAI47_17685 [Deltaproteobacteria bacterium]|nr:hypothetical protein [Deltaproteobacteria bacterium]
MKLGFFLGLGLLVGGLLGTAGCKKHSSQAVPPIVSPLVNPAAVATDPFDDEDPGADPADDPAGGTAAAPAPVRAPSNEKDWREDDDEKKSTQADKRGASKGVTPSSAASEKKGEPQETAEEKKKRLDREATLHSVDNALRGVTASIKRCYDQSEAKAGNATLRFRVHRSGYVMSPSVSGVSGKVKVCIEQVLSRLRVSGVKTSSLNVTRTLRFKRR